MTEYHFDLESFDIEEYTNLRDSQMGDRASDEILARASGIPLEKIKKMKYNEYRRFLRAFFKVCNEPLADPL